LEGDVSGLSFKFGFGGDSHGMRGSLIGAINGRCGGAVSITPFTCPTFSVVSVYVHGHTTPTIGRVVSWNPVISVEAPVVAIPPLLITVWIPWLVIPAPPPSAPNAR